jgi:hypothetical protein
MDVHLAAEGLDIKLLHSGPYLLIVDVFQVRAVSGAAAGV